MGRFGIADRTRSRETLTGSTSSHLHRRRSPSDLRRPSQPLFYDESLIDAYESREIRPPPRQSPEIVISSGPRGGRSRRTRGRGRPRGRGRLPSRFVPTRKRNACEVSVSESSDSSSIQVPEIPGDDPVEEVSLDEEVVQSACVPVATTPLKKAKAKEEISHTEKSRESDDNVFEFLGGVSRAGIAGRTRAQKGDQGRVSYVEYFENEDSSSSSSDDEDEEEEEEKSDYSSSSKEDEEESADVMLVQKNRTLSRNESEEKMGRRTRSRFSSSSSEQRKLGTVSTPICLDEDEDEPEASALAKGASPDISLQSLSFNNWKEKDRVHSESTSKKRKIASPDSSLRSLSFNGGDPIDLDEINSEFDTEMSVEEASASEKTKPGQKFKQEDLCKMLVDTILYKDKNLPEEFTKEKPPMNPQNESSISDFPPLIFSFEDEDPKPAEISEHDKEIDQLWADMEFALDINNIRDL